MNHLKIIVLTILASLLLVACSQGVATSVEPPLQPIQLQDENAKPESSLPPPPTLEADQLVLKERSQGDNTVENITNPEVSTKDSNPETLPSQNNWPVGEEKLDAQGFVEVAITPLNLNNLTAKMLDFEVNLNTHSVDLSMDLASLATLTSDNGFSVEATGWDAPIGGHHVDGVLSFPVELDGSALLNNASRLTLTIRDVDAPERIFVWEVME